MLFRSQALIQQPIQPPHPLPLPALPQRLLGPQHQLARRSRHLAELRRVRETQPVCGFGVVDGVVGASKCDAGVRGKVVGFHPFGVEAQCDFGVEETLGEFGEAEAGLRAVGEDEVVGGVFEGAGRWLVWVHGGGWVGMGGGRRRLAYAWV